MNIEVVTNADKEFVMSYDKHINDIGYANRVLTKSGYVLWQNGERVGIMSYCVLWDRQRTNRIAWNM